MEIKDITEKILPVLKKHDIVRAGLFGSYAVGKATKKSDFDILVELSEGVSLLDFIGIKYELEDLLGNKVDLVEYKAIKPSLRNQIIDQEVRIYG